MACKEVAKASYMEAPYSTEACMEACMEGCTEGCMALGMALGMPCNAVLRSSSSCSCLAQSEPFDRFVSPGQPPSSNSFRCYSLPYC